MRWLASGIAVFLFATLGFACGCSEAAGGDPQEPPAPVTRPTPEPPKPTPSPETPAKPDAGPAATKVEGIPALTGDKARDKQALLDALARIEKEWTATKAELAKLTKDGQVTNPDPKKLAELKARNDRHKAAADEVEKLLSKLQS